MQADLDRRRFLRQAGAAALATSALARHVRAQAPARVAPITMVINQSPWFGGTARPHTHNRGQSSNAIRRCR